MVGTTISHYKVLEKIGQGGIGELYKAEGTRLGGPAKNSEPVQHLGMVGARS